jgi:hypothetical protein
MEPLHEVNQQYDNDTDLVNHPPHYNQSGIECIDAIEACLGPEGFEAYLKGNVIKYLWRERYKGGTQDIKKAIWYNDKLALTRKKRDKD